MVATNLSMANIPYWGMLPMMYTNYGGDTQISTVEPYQSYNIGLAFNPIAQQSWGMQGVNACTAITPQVNVQAIAKEVQAMVGQALNQMTNNNLKLCINNVAQTKARLQAKMNAEGTTEEQKKEIQKMLDKIEEKEKELKEIAKSTNLDPQTAYNKVKELENSINELVKESINLINGTGSTGSTDSTGSTGSTESTGSTGSTGSTESTGSTDSTGSTSSTGSTVSTEEPQGAVDNFDSDVRTAVDQFYDATYCPGTKDKEMEEVLNLVNKDNVMDLMLCWNKLHSAECGESLMDAFMWDADSSQKEKYCKLISRALRDKAEELGLADECAADFAAIDKEVRSWFFISNDISKNFNNIIKKIGDKMGSKYSSPYNKNGK